MRITNFTLAISTTLLLSFLVLAQATDFTNSIGMEFKEIPAGAFYMGTCKLSKRQKQINDRRKSRGLEVEHKACPSGAMPSEKVAINEGPEHKVTISKAFQLGVYEVTLGQFKQFIGATGRLDLLSGNFMQANQVSNDAAVTYVSWNDVQNFIIWLNDIEGGNRYRLPTEAEWEYAARAGTITLYSWGSSVLPANDYAWYGNSADDAVGSIRHAQAVGMKKPNPWGLYDIHGNAYEWVADWYSDNYYSESPTYDPLGPSKGQFRVIRGGSWFHARLSSTHRNGAKPDSRNDKIGFRLVRQP